jgi:hypothetical protein
LRRHVVGFVSAVDIMQRLSELGYDADRLDDMRRLIDAP